MIRWKDKVRLFNELIPLRIWIDNYGSIRYSELYFDINENLSYYGSRHNQKDIERFIKGVCKVSFPYDPTITKMYI